MTERPPDDQYVFHGSPTEFDSEEAKPKRNRRTRKNTDGDVEVIFDEESFHATPHKWIALAYTYQGNQQESSGGALRYNMGVSLYENTENVRIYGYGSLEESLEALYGKGGYLYHFDKDKFIYKEGLGNLELIVQTPTLPLTVERIDNPVEEMKKLGVTFEFVDLSLPENQEIRSKLR